MLRGLLVLMFAGLLAWTWQCWADPMVDFGREFYVARGVAEGGMLYRDLAYFNGPLSPLVNAAWLRLLGPSLLSLALANAALAALLGVGIFALVRRGFGEGVATLATAVYLGGFAIGQRVTVGNYNYITPYSHELTHGLLLALPMILLMGRRLRGGRVRLAAAIGLLYGLSMMTKAEVSLAATAAVGAFGVLGLTRASAAKLGWRDLGLFAAGAAVAPLGFGLFFLIRGDAGLALRALGGTWYAIAQKGAADSPFYRSLAGLDDPVGRIRAMLGTFGYLVLIVLTLGFTDRALRTRGASAVTLAVAGFAGLWWFHEPGSAYALNGPGLAPAMLAVGGVLAWLCVGWGIGHDPERSARLVPLAIFSAFALAFLAKIGLNTTLRLYGFTLAMPATLLVAVTLGGLVPELLKRLQGEGAGDTFRRLGMALVVADLLLAVRTTGVYLQQMTVSIGDGADRIHTYAAGTPADAIQKKFLASGEEIVDAIARLKSLSRPGQTLMVLPEGVMINIQTGLRNPTPYVNFQPTEMSIFGEDTILSAMKSHPPDFVLIVHKDPIEHGVGPFGSADNGSKLFGFVRENYRLIETISDGRPEGEPGIRVYAR